MKLFVLYAGIPGGELIYFNSYSFVTRMESDRIALEAVGCFTSVTETEVLGV